MDYLADTVVVIRHFAQIGRLGSTARRILSRAEAGDDTLYISAISFMEILYLAERNRIPITLHETRHRIQAASNYQVVDLSLDIIGEAQQVQDLELHDRMIVATARHWDVPLLTSDREITASGLVQVIW